MTPAPVQQSTPASSPETATPAAPKYVRLKYEMCKNFKEKGVCKYGDRCLFAHGDHELVKRGQVPTSTTSNASPVKEEAAPKDKEPSSNEVSNNTVAAESTRLTNEDKQESSTVSEAKDNVKEMSLTISEVPSKAESCEPSSAELESSNNLDDLDEEDQGENSTTLSSTENRQAAPD